MQDEIANWSGSVRFTPDEVACPRDEDELVEVVRRAARQGRTVRPIGSGHSSMPLFSTDDVLVSVEDLDGVLGHDERTGCTTVGAGMPLASLGAGLEEHGVALDNFGDVDYQTISGAVGTGTHGTGINLGNLSSMVVGARLVTAAGEVVEIDEETDGGDLLRAAQVSLGSLGVFSALTLTTEPAHELHRLNWCTHIDWVLDHFAQLVAENRHFDFYWYPRSDVAQVRTMNQPGDEPDLVPPGRIHADETGPNYEIIPNDRQLKYEELEYMLPFDPELTAFREARERIKQRHRHIVGWRVLVRTVAPDEAMISHCTGRPSMSIALLQNVELPHEEYFDDMEPLLRAHQGRPHWGKKHSLKAAELASLYPEWGSFQEIRRRLDPDGTFMNDHLRDLFEDAA